MDNIYTVAQDIVYIILPNKLITTVSKNTFYSLVEKIKHIGYWKCKTNHYARATLDNGQRVYLHKLIKQSSNGELVDHIDHNGLNNIDNNLRLCNTSQNVFNRRSAQINNISTRIRGICYTVAKANIKGITYEYPVYQAYFKAGNKNKRVLKNFGTLKEAETFIKNYRPKTI